MTIIDFGAARTKIARRPASSRTRRTRPSILELLEERALLTTDYLQSALVADQPGHALIQDPNLINPWGIGLDANGGELSISDTVKGVATFYGGDVNGAPFTQDPLVVSVPGGSPTGEIFNGTSSFSVGGAPATFLFVGRSGDVSGWNAGTTAQLGASVQNADFTGITTELSSQNELYATDFRNGKIDVFDPAFNPVIPTGTFADPNVPAGMAPFNIAYLNGDLYVTYAPANNTAGSGFLAVFDPNGNLITDMPAAAANNLDVPWGMAIATGGFGGLDGDLLVANAGNGRIEAFNTQTLDFVGTVLDTNGSALTIDGLKAIAMGNGLSAGDSNTLFFTAGPNNHQHGLIGSIVSADDNPLDSVGDSIAVSVGSQFSGVVATFAEANLSEAAGSLGAHIDWGDGTTSTGAVISLGAGRFNVDGSHTYSRTGSFNITVTITDDQNHTTIAKSIAQSTDNGTGALSVSGVNPSATEGQAFSGTVATFTDGDGNKTAGAYTATVDWGDGITTSGTVTASGGSFSVLGSHTYANSGSFTITVIVNDNDGASGTASASASIAGSTLSVTGDNLSLTENTTFNGAVATFSDSNPNAGPGDFGASIRWGDGATTTGTISSSGGGFQVTGQHTYGDEGNNSLAVVIHDASGATSTASGTATISEADVLSGQLSLSALTEGATNSQVIATFSDTNTSAVAGGFNSSIDWGDGSTSSGTISGSGGSFSVSGTHAYADEGSFTVRVTLMDDAPGSASAAASGTLNVGEGDVLTAITTSPTATEGLAFGGALATFNDQDLSAAASGFTASIAWGDGATTAGTVSGSGGTLVVNGNHAYSEEGTYSAQVTLGDNAPGTASATANVAVNVADAPLQITSPGISSTEGVLFSGTVASMSDADPNATAADFTATVAWGDGTTTAGTVVGNGQGGFNIEGQHSYAEGGSYPVSVNVRDAGGSSTSTLVMAAIADYSLVGSPATLSGVEGAAFSGRVATFNDLDPDGGSAGEYSVTIDWGDGAQSAGTVTGSAGRYTVSGNHNFADESNVVTVTIRDAGGAADVVQSPANIADDDVLAVAGVTIAATEGQTFTGKVATFTDTNSANAASDLVATIDWGDGTTPSSGTINTAGDGTFTVVAGHTYVEEAAGKAMSVVIADEGGATITARGVANIADASLSASGTTVPSAGGPLSGVVVANFTDSGGAEAPADYTATIDWGDGTATTAGGIAPAAGGGLAVTGSHSYGDSNNHAITVTIHDEGGATTQATSQFLFGDANARFVGAAFLDVLGRPIDASGLAFWDQQLDGGQSRTVVVDAIDHSAEYFANQIVTPAYQRYLGRSPDSGGLVYWVDQLQNHGLSDERLEAGFVASPEFYQHAGGTDKSFVDAIYVDLLGRAADSQGEAFWVGQLAQGAQRADVAYGFAASLERERQRVSDDYMHYLGRLPDQQGIDFFVNQFAHGVSNESVITGFVASDEYFAKHTT